MIGFLIRTTPGAGISEEEVREAYTANLERYRRPEQVHLRQILTSDLETAQQAQAALVRGQAFEQVAARFSQGPMAAKGGDQGRLGKEDLPVEFAEMIFALEEGRVSGIVKADYGFHIFQVLAQHPAEITSFEEAAPGIRRELELQIADERMRRFLAEARERYNVKIYENNLPFEYRGAYGT
jgi:parvulin-like peptidyl-prolyl isomerase